MSKEQIIKNINQFISKKDSSLWRDRVEYREANKHWLRKSAKIAIKLNRFLRDSKMTQKQLANRVGVSPQQISKILKGTENLTLETVTKLEISLGIKLIEILKNDESVISQPKAMDNMYTELFKSLTLEIKQAINSESKFSIIKEVGLIESKSLTELRKFTAAPISRIKKKKSDAGESNYSLAA